MNYPNNNLFKEVIIEDENEAGERTYNSRLSGGTNPANLSKNRNGNVYGAPNQALTMNGPNRKSFGEQYSYGHNNPHATTNAHSGTRSGHARDKTGDADSNGFQSASPTPQRANNKMNTALKIQI